MVLPAWVTRNSWTSRPPRSLRTKKNVGGAVGWASHPLTGARPDMKTSHTFTSTSLAALVASLGLIACGAAETEPASQSQTAAVGQSAQPGREDEPTAEAMRPEAADGERRGWRGKGRHGPPSPDKMLERFDANKNGSLEAAELPERMQEHLGE